MKFLPDGATICSVKRRGDNQYTINCAGFFHYYQSLADAAKALEVDWMDLQEALQGPAAMAILFRPGGRGGWELNPKVKEIDIGKDK